MSDEARLAALADDPDLYAETFTAAGEQYAGCGHFVRPGEHVVTLRTGDAFGHPVAVLCGRCWHRLGRLGARP